MKVIIYGAGGFMGAATETNRRAMEVEAEKTAEKAALGAWTCACGSENTGKFCSECGKKKEEVTNVKS